MAKKVKYYGVFVKRTIKNELPKELIEMLSKHGELVGLNSSKIEVHVFDNELEQIECALNVRGTVIETIDAVDKADFLAQVDKLKAKYEEDEEESGDDCEEEQPTTEQKEPLYNVMLTDIINISEKIPTVKAVIEALNIGIKEAKDLVDAVNDSPSILAERVSKLEADRIARFITSRCNCRIAVTKLN